MHIAMNPPFHADHVGSLRRPPALIEAHTAHLQGKLSREALKELEDKGELIDDYIAAINDAVRDRPAGMTICVHLCRGNQGHGQASGGYDPVAERLLQN